MESVNWTQTICQSFRKVPRNREATAVSFLRGPVLGEGGLFWDGKRKKYRVWACEGGHTDFGPRNELEIALLEYLIKEYGHVSYERVVSGMGLENIYKFLRDTGRERELPEVASEMETHKPGLVISKYADSGKCQMCVQTIEIFVSCVWRRGWEHGAEDDGHRRRLPGRGHSGQNVQLCPERRFYSGV